MRDAMTILVALERECLRVDTAIAKLDWPACESSWRAQRRLTHELERAVAELPATSPEYERAMKRIARLRLYRDGQLNRLRAYRDSIGKRLALLGRSRSLRKAITPERTSRLLDWTS